MLVMLMGFCMVLFVSILSSKLSNKLGIPTLIFFLLIGIFVGQYKPELIPGDHQLIAQRLGMLALVLVLFSGGLETEFKHIRPIWKSGILLSTLGALITALLVGYFLKWSTAGTLNLSLWEGLLVGTIVASTDAAAVFSILRARNIKLKANLGELLEFESGSNDVMVFFLMNIFLKMLAGGDVGVMGVILSFIKEMVIGFAGGLLLGYAMVFVINKINLSYPGLYPAFVLSMLFMGYALVSKLHGSGFLAVYICGMVLGNNDLLHKKSLIQFYKGMGWLMQIMMFIALGVLADLGKLMEIIPYGLKLAFILMVVARPLSVFLAMHFSSFAVRHKAFISWVGLRGAVPIVFAAYLHGKNGLAEGKYEAIFHLIFFVVIISVLLQGTTLYPCARWLKLDNKIVTARQEKQVRQLSDVVKRMLIQFEVPADSAVDGKSVVTLGLPESVHIAIIHRENQYLQPRGDTQIKVGDRLVVMLDTKKDLNEVKSILGIR